MQNKLLDIFDDLMTDYELYEYDIDFGKEPDNYFFPDDGPHPVYWLEQNKFGYETSHGLIEYHLNNNLQPTKILFYTTEEEYLDVSDTEYPDDRITVWHDKKLTNWIENYDRKYYAPTIHIEIDEEFENIKLVRSNTKLYHSKHKRED